MNRNAKAALEDLSAELDISITAVLAKLDAGDAATCKRFKELAGFDFPGSDNLFNRVQK